MKRLQPTDELHFDDAIVSVIETGPESVALFIEGSRRNYTLATMPVKLAVEIATFGTDEKSPDAQVFFGAFQAVDPQGDRAAVRKLWASAAASGVDVDELLPFLDRPSPAIDRENVPERRALAEAVDRIDKQFSAQIGLAKSTQRKSELAASLIAAARTADESADQYALLAQASRWATSAPDPRVALAAIDELALWFDVDALSLKSAALSKCSATPTNSATSHQIASAALELLDQAEKDHRDDLAASLVESAATAAPKSRDAELIKKANARRRELDKPEKKAS